MVEQASTPITYEQAGVSTAEGARAVDAIKDAVKRTYRPEVVGDIGGFGGLFSVAAAKDMADPLLVSGTDGVGTKLKLAQILDNHGTVGIDLVAMCVNDVLATGAEPLFFLDYIAIGKLKAEAVSTIVSGIADGCEQAGCALIGGEMAEHPGVMEADDYDLSGFCVALVDRPRMLDPKRVREGDVLIGLASSGIHSNGYSLVRKVCVECHDTEEKARQALALTYSGDDVRSLGEALLAPTKIYVKPVLKVLHDAPDAVHSLAHITGGGITENLNRALPDDLDAQVQVGSWPVPPIISHVCELAHLNQEEAFKTFNMGIGMVLVISQERVEEVTRALSAAGEVYFEIGTVVPGSGRVVYTSSNQ